MGLQSGVYPAFLVHCNTLKNEESALLWEAWGLGREVILLPVW